ncbi:MAG: hypothetical protein CSA97_05595 [Bacteroidetes bacterium]|nr:MAG: hypothetical protein CSA97_05595 [Bacteroidota bacterium]
MRKRLEFKDSSSDKFWEIEVLGSSHTVRFGRMGTDGQEKVKEFKDEATALKDAEKLVASKLRKGYVEVEAGEVRLPVVEEQVPVTLEYMPMPEEKVGLFTPEQLKNLNEFRAAYWRRKMDGLMRETVYDGHYRMEPTESLSSLADQFEEFASWELADMQKVVERNANGQVSAIRYSINGQEVLALVRHVENGYIHGRIIPFFIELPWEAYRFGKKGRMVLGTRRLLIRYARFCAEHLEQIEGAELKHSKDAKIRSVAEGSIPLVVESLMAETGYEYAMTETAKTVLLRVRVRKRRFVEISLPHRSFLQRVGDVLPTLERVERLLNEYEIPFLLGNKEGCPDWGKVEVEFEDWSVVERTHLRQELFRGMSDHELQKAVKLYQMAINTLAQVLPASLEGTGYQHSVDLNLRHHRWMEGYRAEVDVYPASLHVAMPQRKVLHLLFDYENFSDYLPHIVPTIELVKVAMEEAKLGFKLLSTKSYEHRSLGWERD